MEEEFIIKVPSPEEYQHMRCMSKFFKICGNVSLQRYLSGMKKHVNIVIFSHPLANKGTFYIPLGFVAFTINQGIVYIKEMCDFSNLIVMEEIMATISLYIPERIDIIKIMFNKLKQYENAIAYSYKPTRQNEYEYLVEELGFQNLSELKDIIYQEIPDYMYRFGKQDLIFYN